MHSLYPTILAIKELTILNREYQSIQGWLIQHIILDALISNSDRHLRNYSLFAHKGGQITIMSIFDNRCSFCKKYSENQILVDLQMVAEECRGFGKTHSQILRFLKGIPEESTGINNTVNHILIKILNESTWKLISKVVEDSEHTDAQKRLF